MLKGQVAVVEHVVQEAEAPASRSLAVGNIAGGTNNMMMWDQPSSKQRHEEC